MYKNILLIILILTFFSSCKNIEDKNTDVLNNTNLQDKSLENNSKPGLYSDLEEAISNAIIDNNIGKYTEGEYQTESHVNLSIDESDEFVEL